MSKTKLRQEYESVFGVVEGRFSLYYANSVDGVTLDKREIEKVERSDLAEKLSKITDEQLDDLALVARLAGRDAIRKELQQIIEQ